MAMLYSRIDQMHLRNSRRKSNSQPQNRLINGLDKEGRSSTWPLTLTALGERVTFTGRKLRYYYPLPHLIEQCTFLKDPFFSLVMVDQYSPESLTWLVKSYM